MAKGAASGKVRRDAAKYGVLMLAISSGATWCGARFAQTGHDPLAPSRPNLGPGEYFLWALVALAIAVGLFGVAAGFWKPSRPSS